MIEALRRFRCWLFRSHGHDDRPYYCMDCWKVIR